MFGISDLLALLLFGRESSNTNIQFLFRIKTHMQACRGYGTFCPCLFEGNSANY